MGAKEVMASAPIVVVLYDRCFIFGSYREAFRRRWPLYLGLAMTWAILGALLIAYPQGGNTAAGFGVAAITPVQYAVSQFGVILRYLRLAFWPVGLCLDYGRPVARMTGEILPGLIGVGTLLAATIWALIRRPRWGFLGACFFLILAPTSSIVPIKDLAFEHRMYLPLAAVVAASVLAAYWLVSWLGFSILHFALCALAIAIALGTGTYLRNRTYRTANSMWQDVREKAPRNPRGWCNLGLSLANAGSLREAVRDYTQAIDLKADYLEAYNDREDAYARLGRFDDAMNDCNREIEISGDSASPYNNRGNLFAQTGHFDEALLDYGKAIQLQPDFALAWCNRGNCKARAGRLADAVGDYTKAIALQADYAEAYKSRAIVYMATGRPADALPDFNKTIALKPDDADAYGMRAVLYADKKEFNQALQDIAACVKLGGTPDPAFVKSVAEAAGRDQPSTEIGQPPFAK